MNWLSTDEGTSTVLDVAAFDRAVEQVRMADALPSIEILSPTEYRRRRLLWENRR